MNGKLNYKKIIIKIVITTLTLAILCAIGYLILKKFGLTNLSKEQLQEKIASYGSLGPIIYIIICFLQVTIIPIPSTVVIIAGSYLFTPFISFFYSFIGVILGSLFAFFLGRKLGKPFINWLIGDKDVVNYYLNKMKNKDAILLFAMMILPFFPDDALCSIAGILPMTFQTFFVILLVSRIITIAFTIFFMSGEIIPYHNWGIVVIILGTILGIIACIVAYKKADKINEWIVRIKKKK